MGFDANVYLVTLTLIAFFNLALAPRSMFFCLLSHIARMGISPRLLLRAPWIHESTGCQKKEFSRLATGVRSIAGRVHLTI